MKFWNGATRDYNHTSTDAYCIQFREQLQDLLFSVRKTDNSKKCETAERNVQTLL